ncbi:hypothetical protein LEMLEM_LOCUS4131 [Lemmus lemmus]
MVGQAAVCQERWLLPSMHCSPPTPVRRLTEFWLDRQGQRNHNSTVAEAHISYPDGETLSDRRAMRSSSRSSDLRSTCLHIPQSLGLASAESVWWPGSPCRAQCCRRGEWAAAKRRDANLSPMTPGWLEFTRRT